MNFEEALCKDMPPDYMYPPRGKMEAIRAALNVCDGCPAAEPCLEFALETGERHGVWGGVFLEEPRLGHFNRRTKVAS